MEGVKQVPISDRWMQTSMGIEYYPDEMSEDRISIHDIANGLSNLCRFCGQTDGFYSVAQHSWFVSQHVPLEYQMWGLLHDAAEAYIGDLINAVKHGFPRIKEDFCALEDSILRVIAKKFGLECYVPHIMPLEVHDIDKLILAAEARDLFVTGRIKEFCRHSMVDSVPLISPWSPAFARDMFVRRFVELGGEI